MFAYPSVLWLLWIVPWLAWRMFGRDDVTAISFSGVRWSAEFTPTLRQRLMWLPDALTLVGLAVLIVALARPREGRQQVITGSDGIAIEMVVDRSGSMRAMDFQLDGRPVDRLTAIKDVAGRFVLGGDALDGRSTHLDGRTTDLVGLITFAGYADDQSPPTLDHPFLVSSLQMAEIVDRRDEDGTAIGDAIALAVEKLNALDARQDEKVKSKIIILLTDGENTAGVIDPIQAAEIAQTMGIKVYAIGVGTQGRAPVPVVDMFGRKRIEYMAVSIDEATLRQVAQATGGQYFRATDTDSLSQIYEQIDELEKTEVESIRYTDYREWAVQTITTRWGRIPPLLIIAAVVMLVRVGLQTIWLRTVP